MQRAVRGAVRRLATSGVVKRTATAGAAAGAAGAVQRGRAVQLYQWPVHRTAAGAQLLGYHQHQQQRQQQRHNSSSSNSIIITMPRRSARVAAKQDEAESKKQQQEHEAAAEQDQQEQAVQQQQEEEDAGETNAPKRAKKATLKKEKAVKGKKSSRSASTKQASDGTPQQKKKQSLKKAASAGVPREPTQRPKPLDTKHKPVKILSWNVNGLRAVVRNSLNHLQELVDVSIGLTRLDYRVEEWNQDLLAYVQALEKTKPVLITGDLNVAHLDEDIYNYDAKHIAKVAGCTPREREGFTQFLNEGFVDTFRHLHGNVKGNFTYWSARTHGREHDKGLRLDYFVCSKRMTESLPKVHDSYQLHKVLGSDHCPVGAVVQTA
ncbi:hypothetical protein PTSG_07951 [Salpingoeca rosetta]|uniref:DNA-(apurinic or apyrimidinic site) endonuclease n=1 Tax=Salpingoeca rosetta (strain ATCC 50818 / BSB-021) TaxID=946362 RepID=F2UGT3_SALR5|nr:uncharacterized protein PTSG_07951 [Salpingoeca rosetta]EGD75833.1 hypothetical protein PTSG_07951 [Salpingoeca rosetta]|eukprot:XP_004991754.1 hypothetical protein PTSG_07951 [Salpingoeca rosetta]